MKKMGIILAGGKSERMGQDKANLIWKEGKTLLDHQVHLLSSIVGRENVFVSGYRLGYNSVVDLVSGRGPLEGVRSVLFEAEKQSLSYSAVFLVPVDMPLLSPIVLADLFDSAFNVDGAKYRQCQLPVVFRNLPKLKKALMKMESDLSKAGESHFSFWHLYSYLTLAELNIQDEKLLLGVNTPEEWTYAVSKANSVV